MPSRDLKDIVSGGALAGLGALATVHAARTLDLGSVNFMGPGMFPMALGVLLCLLGLAVMIPAFFRAGTMPGFDVRALVWIGASILSFALLARPFGLVPAVVVLTFIASRADGKLSLARTALLAAGLSATVTLIFRVGLGLQLPVADWPW